MRAIEERHGSLGDWCVDEADWSVELLYLHHETFHGLTLEIALARCRVYLITDKLGIEEFASYSDARSADCF